jgi:hypothetical protein
MGGHSGAGRLGRRSASGFALALALVAIASVACGGDAPVPSGDDVPWDEPVADAVAVTEWREDGEPVGPFGPDGPEWESPEDLVASVAAALAQSDDITTTAQVASRSGDVAVGWVRVEAAGDNALAADLRLDMRRDGSAWFVTAGESRVHCAVPLVDAACP